VIEEQRSPRETPCPHCGGGAKWYFLDEAETVVEVMCEDCGVSTPTWAATARFDRGTAF